MASTIQVNRKKYESMVDTLDRLRETVEVLSDKSTVRKIGKALKRVEAGEYLTKKDLTG